MNLLRSVLFALLFYPGTLFFCLGVVLVTPLGEAPVQAIVHGWAKFHFWLVRHVLRIKVRWEGEIPSGPFLIAVKHQSMMEAVDTLRFGDVPVVVMKRELADMPLWGKVARTYGIIGVDREAGASALRAMMAEAKAATSTGRPVIIFPEGTRVPFGEAPELRPGFAGLYRGLGLPVVPIAHDIGRLWGRGFVHRSGTATFRVGEIIPAGLKRNEVEARVREAINQLNPAG
jgi:1-acyl-sn-glycerol-3-phosphate acyltransferase